MLKMFPELAFGAFTTLIMNGWTTASAAEVVGLDFFTSTWIAAEIRQRKPLELKQLLDFEEYLELGMSVQDAAEATGIPPAPAAPLAAAYRKAVA